jgi:hypothetical protein
MWKYQIAAAALGIVCVVLVLWIVKLKHTTSELRSETDRLRSENEQLSNQLKEAVDQLAVLNKEPTAKRFTKLVDLLVSAGIPGLIFLGAVAASGFYGAAAITATLAALGGPWGMLGGVSLLILLTAVLSQCSLLDVSRAVITRLLQTKSKHQIVREIDSLPRIIPEKFRVKAKALLEDA